ncbi:MAG: HigA family addiction module antidote protein [Alphaproteobacteria bacterium]|nr:HigA family addiction module antidote protein [Alphaproteobacteria bacterium]
MEHPGPRIRRRFLDPLGINAHQLANGLGVNRSTVSRLLAGDQPVTPAMAARLGVYFGVPARWFLLMQAEYDASRLEGDTSVVQGVEPAEIDPDWLLTPEGAIFLSAPPVESTSSTVRTVRLENGAVALLGNAS